MKKTISLLLTFLLLVSFVAFALGSSESSDENQGTGSASTDKGNLGDYDVQINSCRVSMDYEGNPIVIVKYTFKNVANDDAASFTLSVSDKVYQNGIELETCYSVDNSAEYSSENQSTNIKKGASIEVEVAYSLKDVSSDVDVEVEQLFSFDDKSVRKTFKLENVELPEQGNLGKYNVEIQGCRVAVDYEGKAVVIVKYIFENVLDSDAVSFTWTISDRVYQNGVELENAYFLEDDAQYDSNPQSTEIQKGKSIEVEVAYLLNDSTSDIEVKLTKLVSIDERAVEKTMAIVAEQ